MNGGLHGQTTIGWNAECSKTAGVSEANMPPARDRRPPAVFDSKENLMGRNVFVRIYKGSPIDLRGRVLNEVEEK